MLQYTPQNIFLNLLKHERLQAIATISGNDNYPDLNGTVRFYSSPYQQGTMYGGALVEAEIFNLPDQESPESSGFFGFHIHEYGDCSDNFSRADGHFNPNKQIHPYHAGDFPPLLSNDGYAWMSFWDARIQIADIIGRSIIIHQGVDDFTSQPSGNSGEMIACGVIRPIQRM